MHTGISNEEVLILGTAGMLLLAFSIVLFIYLYQRKLIKKNLENQQIQNLLREQETKTTYALLEGQDKERKRIAAELHDNLGSILVTLNMYADALQTKKPEEMKRLAEKIGETTRLANEETRKISHSLDSGMLNHFGLEAAIKQLSEAVSSIRKLTFDISIQIEENLGSEISLEIYRMIQEMVNNTLKHAKATKIHLELTQMGKSLNLIFEDNGIGFNRNEINRGMGLKNIESRVQKLNGDLTIDSRINKGSTFIIEISEV